jgi:cyclophilin family peptidyl-prolyl cis-trans isomerase
MKHLNWIFTALLSLLLAGCFHTQLKGSVGDATLTIAPLRNPDTVLASFRSLLPADLIEAWGEELWEEQSSLIQLAFVGIATLAPKGLDPDALYLVTASGGEDFDPRLKMALSNSPVNVQGQWHAIISGRRIADGNLKVSALTEALYRQLQPRVDEWSDAEVQVRLDASATLMVADVDGSGGVDYNDVLLWNRTLDGALYRGRLSALDGLSTAIISGQPIEIIEKKARQVLGKTKVLLEFDAGDVIVETLNWQAPITAANFVAYVRDGFYEQVLVHRAIDGFMIQMGFVEVTGTDSQGALLLQQKTPNAPIVNESSNGLANNRGTLSMARTASPDSASSQFFINQVANPFLDYNSFQNPAGYAVFARVGSGIEVVDQIAAEPTGSLGGIGNDVPIRGVILKSARLL